MRKVITTTLVAILLATFFSCGSDDNDGAVDPITGKWKISKRFENGTEATLRDCEKNDFYTFANNNSFEEFAYEPENKICKESKDVGTWIKIEEGKYKATYKGNNNIDFDWKLSKDGKTLTDSELSSNSGVKIIYIKE